MTVVFDLDGVLIDSEELIRSSYREAGAEPPENFLSIGNHDWLEGADRERIHQRKNEIYLRDLPLKVKYLPAWQTAELLAERGVPVCILTGAPKGTARVLRSCAPSWPFLKVTEACWPAIKEAHLETHSGTGVYIDDQQHVRVPEFWKFVRYTGQSAADLFKEITR